MFFKKDGTTIHTAHNLKANLSNIFGDQNSHPLWPVHSPDLIIFFFGGGGEDSEYKNSRHIQDELEKFTRTAVLAVKSRHELQFSVILPGVQQVRELKEVISSTFFNML